MLHKFILILNFVALLVAAAEKSRSLHEASDSSSIEISLRRSNLPKNELFIGCAPGFPLSEKTLPPGFVFADKKKTSALLPMGEEIKKTLQPGDILIFAYSQTDLTQNAPADRLNFYRMATQDYQHVGMVFSDSKGELRLLQSPGGSALEKKLTEENYLKMPFHVLRLRNDGNAAERASRVKDINDWARFFATPVKMTVKGKEGVGPIFYYDRSFVPLAVCNPDQKYKLLSAFEDFQKGRQDYQQSFLFQNSRGDDQSNLGFYCSSLPPSVYYLTGYPLPKMEAFGRQLANLENDIQKLGLTAGAKPTPEQMTELLEKYFDHFFSSAARWPDGLATDEERTAYYKSEPRKLPRQVAEYRAKLSALFSTLLKVPPPLRGATFDAVHGPIIAPQDMVDNIFEGDGFLIYGGTYVGEECVKKVWGENSKP